MSLRILVTGSREWTDRTTIRGALLRALELSTIGTPVLIHGAARGADTIAAQEWEWIGRHKTLAVEPYPCTKADWKLHGRAAGHIRNARMVLSGADVCLAFPLGESPGTRDCMRLAEKAGIRVVNYGELDPNPLKEGPR